MRKFYFIVGGIVLFIFISLYFIFWRQEELPYDFVVAERGDIVQEVSVTGRVKASEDVELAFEKTGRISNVYVDVGDRVYAGKTLMQLVNGDILAQLQGAEAELKAQEAKLRELKKGTREEEIRIQEITVENAKTTLEDEQRELEDVQQDAFTKSDDAIRNKVDQFFNNPSGSNPQLDFFGIDSAIEVEVESKRVTMESILDNWSNDLVEENLDEINDFLEDIALLVSNLSSNTGLSQATIDGWKADVSTARSNINIAISNLSSAEEGVRTAQSSLTLKEEELFLKKAGEIEEKVIAQEALVEKAQADVNKFKAELAKTIIRSPIGGIVTNQNAEVGESVAANSSLVSIISESNFEIKADVPEVDVAKMELGDTAKVTLDAYGDDVLFSAAVVAIDPAETMIEGVPSYQTTLQFKEDDVRIRSGMTANLDILTNERRNVIVVPQRSVITKNDKKFARVLDNEEIVEKEVKTGLKNSYGDVEIVEGISEGDKVITFMREK